MAEADAESVRIRNVLREETYAIRKSKRLKVVSSNRPKLPEKYLTIRVRQASESLKTEKSINLLKELKEAFAEGEENISIFLSVNGALSCLINLLLTQETSIEACCCLTNLATGNHKAVFAVTKASAPYLITFLHGNVIMLQEQCAWTLANMVADSGACRRHLKSQGLLPALIQQLNTPHPIVLEPCAFALSTYTKVEPQDNRYLCEEGILKNISQHFHNSNISDSTKCDLYCIAFHLTAPVDDISDFLLDNGFVNQVVLTFLHEFQHTTLNIIKLTPLLRCLGNLCAGPDLVVARICKHQDFLKYCVQLLSSQHIYLRKETAWLLTNVALSISTSLHDLEFLLRHMDNILKINMQEEVILQILKFGCAAALRFKSADFDSIILKDFVSHVLELIFSDTRKVNTLVQKLLKIVT